MTASDAGSGVGPRRSDGGSDAAGRSTASGGEPPIPDEVAGRLDELDRTIADFMRRWGTLALRLSLAVIFIWFGILKPLGISAAEPLVLATVDWMPLLSGEQWLVLIGWWEVAIGVTFLFHGTVRVAIALLALQMVGTLMPLVLLPEVTFQAGRLPWAPTMEGQYIVKNLLIISAALVVGGTVREEEPPGPSEPA